MTHLKLKIISTYVNVEEEDYLILGGNSIDLRSDPIIQNNETPIPIINASQSFISNECVICLTNPPNVMFCNCGHLCLCSECERKKISNKYPMCKIGNTIIRILNLN